MDATSCQVLSEVCDGGVFIRTGGVAKCVLQVLFSQGWLQGVQGVGSEKAELELVHAV